VGFITQGDGEVIAEMIPMERLPPIPLDPRAADGVSHTLIPIDRMLLRCLIDSWCETSEAVRDTDGERAGSHLPTRPPDRRHHRCYR
jgi:hypothetical protein